MSFQARYPGWCTGCDSPIHRGDECTYEASVVIHDRCNTTGSTFNRRDDDAGFDCEPEEREPQPVITGRRNHQRHCPDCHLVHAGECF
ncbi:hypothetical protein B5566_02555 [Mycobacterium sp. MHSD3]|nr:hypothetical protein B5566_02555 [Mycobacterium sp. MHSD3]